MGLSVHAVCKWPGHTKYRASCCPIHPKYDGMVPKKRYDDQESKLWIKEMWDMMKQKKEREESKKDFKCGVCDRGFARKTRWKAHEVKCKFLRDNGIDCDTVGCHMRLMDRQKMLEHKKICIFQGWCRFCGEEFRNSVKIGDDFYKRSTMMHTTFKNHMMKKRGSRTVVCSSKWCSRRVDVPACGKNKLTVWCERHHTEGERAKEYDEDIERIRTRRRTGANHQSVGGLSMESGRVSGKKRRFKAWIRKWRPGLTVVKTSSIEGAGKGLFAAIDLLPGDRCARYSGVEMDRCARDVSESKYVVKIHNELYLDGKGTDNFEGRFINDGPHSGRSVNARISAARECNTCLATGKKWIHVIVVEVIKAGEEILIDYGDEYRWDDAVENDGRLRSVGQVRL